MSRIKDVSAVLKLQYHLVIGPIYLGTCNIFKLLVENISPHGDGLLVSIFQGGIHCFCINIRRVESMVFINVM